MAGSGCGRHGADAGNWARHAQLSRRGFLAGTSALAAASAAGAVAPPASPRAANLALVAVPTTSFCTMPSKLPRLNDGKEPKNSGDAAPIAFDFSPSTDDQWVQYDWPEPVSVDRIDVYWQEGSEGTELPARYRILYWNGSGFAPVGNPQGLGVSRDAYDSTGFDPVHTPRLRLEISSNGKRPAGILQWKVYGPGTPPALAPAVAAGPDRTVVLGGKTYLAAQVKQLGAPASAVRWRKISGPGDILFANASTAETSAMATSAGDYVLEASASANGKTTASRLRLRAQAAPPAERLEVVYTTPYTITSPFWRARAKALIVNWIPHCVDYCERTDLKEGRGGLDNFIEAAKALRGEPHKPHQGYVFSNAWVHQTVESMCLALMVDPAGDPEIVAAHDGMRATLERWIPIILAAQHPDGYLQTAYTLADRKEWPQRWDPAHRGNHEGYVSGYFIESAINHYTLTKGQDQRLYHAARRLADCWVANIGPGKKAWFDGHQEMEQALVRFGRFVNDMEGGGQGDAYIALARFLLESRRGGDEYDQSHLPPSRQYQAVGHAVRAVYFYSGMADIAAETGDRDYQSAVASLWDNMVNRKYYVTGGIGSGDSSEGFGDDYALKNDAYCESCSSCGLIFFQYKLNLAYHDARYADLYEETMYNALLGATDIDGHHYTYTNPLINTERYAWHDCPCCVGNIPRTLLMMPTWAYAKSPQGLFVNLFAGSRIDVGEVAGTRVEMVQETDYPWAGTVAITVNPAAPRRFALHLRVPDRTTSELYASTPEVSGLRRLAVNGSEVRAPVVNGYAVIEREWKAGDRVDLELPMAVQRIVSRDVVAATKGKVALRYGPLIYNSEAADRQRLDVPLGNAPLATAWRGDLLNGVMTITGQWADGAPMLAVPNYARMNRAGPSPEFPSHRKEGPTLSQVWMSRIT